MKLKILNIKSQKNNKEDNFINLDKDNNVYQDFNIVIFLLIIIIAATFYFIGYNFGKESVINNKFNETKAKEVINDFLNNPEKVVPRYNTVKGRNIDEMRLLYKEYGYMADSETLNLLKSICDANMNGK